MKTVETVLGPAETEKLGFSLLHEHILSSGAAMRDGKPDPHGKAALSRVRLALMQLKHNYVKTVVDATPVDFGRDPARLIALAEATGLNIIASTGFYNAPDSLCDTPDVERYTDFLVGELTEGMSGTKARAGVIRAAADARGFDGARVRLHRAAAAASRAAGAPIFLHTDRQMRYTARQLDCLAAEGADLNRVKVDHCLDAEETAPLLRLAERGVWLGIDRFFADHDRRTKQIYDLIKLGLADRMLLAHDFCGVSPFDPPLQTGVYAQDANVYGWLYTKYCLFQELSNMGIDEGLLYRIAIDNPKRFFDGC